MCFVFVPYVGEWNRECLRVLVKECIANITKQNRKTIFPRFSHFVVVANQPTVHIVGREGFVTVGVGIGDG